jgi:hypothetical protein
MSSKRRLITRLTFAVLLVSLMVATTVIAAASGSNEPVATSAATNQAVVQQAKRDVHKYMVPVKRLRIPPLRKAPRKGVRLTIISCNVCKPQTSGMQAAAKALGWRVNVVTPQFTPEAYVSAWSSVVQTKPNAIIGIAPFPLNPVARQLSAAKKAGIAVVTQGAGTYPVGGSSPIAADGSGANVFNVQGTLYADVAIADASGAPNAALVIDGSVPAWKAISGSFKRRITASGAKFNQINVSLAEVGKGAPARIVSYLQRNPKTKYLVLTVPAYYIGLKQALKSAGLGKVKIIVGAADSTVEPSLKNGDVLAGVGLETVSGGWRMVDAVARALTRSSLACCTHIGSSYLVVIKRNAGLARGLADYPNRFQDFLRAWKVR